jgi:hypothetical protein
MGPYIKAIRSLAPRDRCSRTAMSCMFVISRGIYDNYI